MWPIKLRVRTFFFQGRGSWRHPGRTRPALSGFLRFRYILLAFTGGQDLPATISGWYNRFSDPRRLQYIQKLPRPAVSLLEEPAFTRHKRCEANFRLDAGSLETYHGQLRPNVKSFSLDLHFAFISGSWRKSAVAWLGVVRGPPDANSVPG